MSAEENETPELPKSRKPRRTKAQMAEARASEAPASEAPAFGAVVIGTSPSVPSFDARVLDRGPVTMTDIDEAITSAIAEYRRRSRIESYAGLVMVLICIAVAIFRK